MKTLMNYTTFSDDLERYESAGELRDFYRKYGCAGLELMPSGEMLPDLVEPDMIVGLHMWCLSDWMDIPTEQLMARYRRDLELARRTGAQYVVFHVTQVSDEECFTYERKHSDEEVVRAAAALVNALLDGQGYTFWFLMENLWWPGLNFLDQEITSLLLELVHYEKKGLMLDTGHFMHTNPDLQTQREALSYLHGMLDAHEKLLPYIKGMHLQQSLSGSYVKNWLSRPLILPADPVERANRLYRHIFQIDRHLPFTDPAVRELVERVDPEYVTYEYITSSKEEHARYLEAGSRALMGDFQKGMIR